MICFRIRVPPGVHILSPFELCGAEDGGIDSYESPSPNSLSTVAVAVAAAAAVAFVVAVAVAFVVAAASCCCYCFLLLFYALCFLLWILERGHPLNSVPIGTL